MTYDVAVVGAGPAGLMAAKGAAEGGLKTVLIEKRKDISNITRACSQQFILDENYQSESMRVEDGKLVFPNNGFSVDYDAPTLGITEIIHISPKGHKVRLATKDGSPCALKYDKQGLLNGIWKKCEHLGVDLRNATVAYDAEDTDDGVAIKLTSQGKKSTLKARKVIAADGVNSRIAEALGMNKDRAFFGGPRCMLYILQGVQDYDYTSWVQFHIGRPYESKTPVILEPCLEGEEYAELITTGGKDRSPEQIYQEVTTKGPLAEVFGDAKLIKRQGATLRLYTPMKIPYHGNALVLGDAATFAEVEVQGALMCGFRGGEAVLKELDNGMGFKEYQEWWLSSFEFHIEDELIAAVSNLMAATLYTDDELDYLFSLVEGEVLDGTYNQWKQHKVIWGAFLSYGEKIAQEKPELWQKITKFQEQKKTLTLDDIYASISMK